MVILCNVILNLDIWIIGRLIKYEWYDEIMNWYVCECVVVCIKSIL